MGEEPLDQILRISRWMTAVAEKTVERRPISFAKSGERLSSGFLRLRLASTQHHGPMRRLKRSTPLLQRSRNCLRGCRGSRNERDLARTKSRELMRSSETPTISAGDAAAFQQRRFQ